MKKVCMHIIGILTTIFMVFIIGLYVGRQQTLKESIPSRANPVISIPSEVSAKKVNINTASIAELCTLPGIGRVTANAIIDYRSAHGPFTSIEELMNVNGIGDKKFDDLIDLISIE